MPGIKIVSILGCGWYGLGLAAALLDKKIAVKGSTTSPDKLQQLSAAKIEPYLVSFSPDKETYDPQFFKCEVLFISIPPKVRTGNAEDYLAKIQRIINVLIANGVKQVVFISSTGLYGDINTEVNELTEPNPDSGSGRALFQAEQLLRQQPGFNTTIIRFAGLIGPGRDPARFFAGKKAIPNGRAPVNLIHLTDCTGFSCAIIDKKAFGHTYNACAPSHPDKAEFYTKATMRSNLEAPEFIDELKNWKIVTSVNVGTLLNYKYKVDDLMGWLDR